VTDPVFCDQCGRYLPPVARYCPKCGAPIVSALAFQPRDPTGDRSAPFRAGSGSGGPVPKPPRSPARTAVIAVSAVVVLILVLMVIPLPLPFNATLQTNALNVGRSQIGSSSSVSLSGSWSTADGGSVTFAIESAGGTTVYSSDAASGSFSFNASDPPYTAAAYSLLPETVQISGTSWSPLIPIGLP